MWCLIGSIFKFHVDRVFSQHFKLGFRLVKFFKFAFVWFSSAPEEPGPVSHYLFSLRSAVATSALKSYFKFPEKTNSAFVCDILGKVSPQNTVIGRLGARRPHMVPRAGGDFTR